MCVIVKRNHRLRFEYQTFYSGKINYQPLTNDQNLYFWPDCIKINVQLWF